MSLPSRPTFNMKASSSSNPMAVSRASYSLQGLQSTSRCYRGRLLQQHWSDLILSVWAAIDGEEENDKRIEKLTCRGSTSPSYTSYALLVVSLLGGNRNHVTTNCENPQLRNAQLPDKAVTFCACANSYISCAWTIAGAFAYFCVYSCYFRTLTFYP